MFVKPTARVAIIGIGGLGHMALKFAHSYGCEVTAFTSNEGKFNEARSFGADHVVATKDADSIKKLAGAFELVISTVNVPLDWDSIVNTLAPNGRLHVVGAVLEPIPVNAFSLILQQQRLRLPHWLANRHRRHARLCHPTQHRPANRTLPSSSCLCITL